MEVLRFEPSPTGPLHLGHARIVLMNDQYRKDHDGKLILRFADTNPKKILPEAYDMILEDLEWLGVKIDEIYYQSDRLELYYEHARRLIEQGHAYVCVGMSPEEIQEYRRRKEPNPQSKRPIEEQLEDFEKMLKGHYSEGEAVVIVILDLNNPNPALREKTILRIIDQEHPRTKDKYKVWPSMNLAVTVDDHLMGVTTVIRGKDLEISTEVQRTMARMLGFDRSIKYIHLGRLHLQGLRLSTSEAKELIEQGKIQGWDDPRLGTLRALRRRGFLPQSIRDFVVSHGLKPNDVHVSLKKLYAFNRKLIDPNAQRRFFVHDKVLCKVQNFPRELDKVVLKNHPINDLGTRELRLYKDNGSCLVYCERSDIEKQEPGSEFRLKDLCNVELVSFNGKEALLNFVSIDYDYAKERKLKKYHWVPYGHCMDAEVLMDDGSVLRGVAEETLKSLNKDMVIQFERFGFVKIEEINDKVKTIFTHP